MGPKELKNGSRFKAQGDGENETDQAVGFRRKLKEIARCKYPFIIISVHRLLYHPFPCAVRLAPCALHLSFNMNLLHLISSSGFFGAERVVWSFAAAR